MENEGLDNSVILRKSIKVWSLLHVLMLNSVTFKVFRKASVLTIQQITVAKCVPFSPPICYMWTGVKVPINNQSVLFQLTVTTMDSLKQSLSSFFVVIQLQTI